MNEKRSGRSYRKLMGGLVLVVGLGLMLAALASGSDLVSFLPLLLVLACPLMMFFMMGSMRHDQRSGMSSDAHHDGVSAEVPDLTGRSRDQQAWALRRELTRMAWRQEALRHDLEQLKAEQQSEQVVDAEHTAGAR